MPRASRGQDTLSSLWAEEKTLQLYNDKKWNELLALGKRALALNYDYYYMQMRVGTAYYEKKNYCAAERYFRRALELNSFDDLPREYLYYCYVFTGRSDQARLLSRSFSKKLAAKTGTDKKSSVDFFMVEAGTKVSDSVSYYDAHKQSYDNFFNPAIYFHAGLNHFIQNRVSLFHAVTFFNQSTFLGLTHQRQYYLRIGIPFKNSWSIAPAFHVVGLSVDTRVPSGPPPMPGMPPKQGTTVTTSNSYYIGSLAIEKMVKKTSMALTNTISGMSGVTQYLHSGMISHYLIGNSKIVVGAVGYLHTINNYKSLNFSYSPFLYWQPADRFSLRLSYLANQSNNIIEYNGYIVNNSPDLTKQRYSALATIGVSKSVSLYGLYQLEFKQESVQSFNYKYNVIVVGLKVVPQ
jgi:hypothetical protein